MSALRPGRWAVRSLPNPGARLRLFCVPYAGGGPQVFQSWPSGLSADVEVVAVNLPGRGRRFVEPAYDRLAPLVVDLAVALEPFLDRPFALFGHSMGALVAFELARHLRAEGGKEPVHLFASGAGAPHLPDKHQFHSLPDERFLDTVRDLNGIDPEVLANEELIELMLPVLRADFAAVETYVCQEAAPLSCPISVFGGDNDWLVPADELEPWRIHTTGACRVRVLAGDHFFLKSAESTLLDLVSARLVTAG